MRGAIVMLNTACPVSNSYYSANYVTPTLDVAALFDSDGIYDTVNRDKFIVPAALDGKYAIIKISVRWEGSPKTGKWVQVFPGRILASGADNESGWPECDPDNRSYLGVTTTDHSSESHPVLLHTGDKFRPRFWQQQASGTAYDLSVMAGTFSLRVLD
jgi:hypothetical protein